MAPQNIIDLLSALSLGVLGAKATTSFPEHPHNAVTIQAHPLLSEISTFYQKPSFHPAKTKNKNAEFREKKKQHSSSLQYRPNLASDNASKLVQRVPLHIISFFNVTYESERD